MNIFDFDGGLFQSDTFTDPVRGARDFGMVAGPMGALAGAAIGTVGRMFRKDADAARARAEQARREAQRKARERRNKAVEQNYARGLAQRQSGAGVSFGKRPESGNGTVTNTPGNASGDKGIAMTEMGAPSILG